MSDPKYGYVKHCANLAYADAVGAVTEALKAEGFGVLTEIDVKATLKKKLDVDFRPYIILGACNPPLAHKALSAEAQIGLLLPCNVVVQEAVDGKGTDISMLNPIEIFKLVGRDDILPVAEDADARLRRALAAVG